MNKILLTALCMVLPASAANASTHSPTAAPNAAVAPQVSGGGDTCGAHDYRYLVGKPMEEARNISGDDYRVVTDATAPATNPKRLTVQVDSRSRVIQQLICG